MPGLDYKRDVPPSVGGASVAEMFIGRKPTLFYDGSPGRETVKCPDCGHRADKLFGDHGGTCVKGSATFDAAHPTAALGIIRKAALSMPRLSINELRAEFDRAAVKETTRGPAFATACRRGWLEPDGHIPSTDPATKRHDVKTYRSLIRAKGGA